VLQYGHHRSWQCGSFLPGDRLHKNSYTLKKHTIYTLRHTYITFRLIYSKNINIYHLAENCGTSVQMIQQYYSDARPDHFVDELSI